MTEPNSAANVMAHAVLGAALAQASGGNAMAGAAGAATSAATAGLIAQHLYGESDSSKLTEEQKQTVAALATLAGGLAGSVGGDAFSGAQMAKNEVENNWLSDKQIAQRNKELKNATSLIEKAMISGT